MSDFLIGLLSALVATNQPAALSNFVVRNTGISINIPNPNDPVEKEYQQLLTDDDAAQEDAVRMIRENRAFRTQGAGLTEEALAGKLEQRLEPVRKAYEDFLLRHPEHVRARLAFGSFLNDTGRELEALEQWERARQLDPKNPAAWNNLANYYGHRGPVKKAFECYAKAIELNPKEPVYYQNLATSVFLFRKDSMEFYGLNEQQVFDRALELYRKALALDPTSFLIAQDLAQTYYGIKPPRHEEAIAAWEQVLKLAADDVQREAIHIHLARTKLGTGRFGEARKHLEQVKNPEYTALKERVMRNVAEKAKQAQGTDQPTEKP